MKTLVSGVQASGKLHIGNYFGAMRQFTEFQDTHKSFVFIANYHALTTIHDKDTLKKNTIDAAIDHLAVGINPEKVIFFKQTEIPELHELTWIFNCLITVPFLSRANSYKDKIAKGIEASVGLFDYPVLMASDILLPGADIVPVGQDQKQHVEYARDIAEKFNNIFGETFTLPEAYIPKTVAIVPGTDGQKMSKSYGNTIPLFGTDEEVQKAIMGIVTDSKSPEEKKNPEEDTIFSLHKLLTPESKLIEIKKGYEDGGLSYAESKKLLLESFHLMFDDMRKRRNELARNPTSVEEILADGGKKAREHAQERMAIIRERVGL